MSESEKISKESPQSTDSSSDQGRGQKGSLKESFRIEKKRLNWIDQGRGLVMFLLVFTGLMPSAWREDKNWFSMFILTHPPKGSQWMNLYDVGVPAFFIIIGLLLVVSFKKRREQNGTKNAVLNSILRWGLILILGVLIILITWDGFYSEKLVAGQTMIVISWDVILAIGIIGLLSIPFMFLSNKVRLIAGYAMMAFYQIMLFVPGVYWREYAAASVHGGIIGGIFVMTSFILVGSCLGEYYLLDKDTPTPKKNQNLAIFALINVGIGVVLWLIPGGYPSKYESSMGWATFSIAIVIGGLLAFIRFDYKDEDLPKMNRINRGRIILFKAYGQNPFLIYTLTVVPIEIIGFIVDEDDQALLGYQIAIWLVFLVLLTAIAIFLYKKGKSISTTKVAGGIILLIVILYVTLVIPGIIEL